VRHYQLDQPCADLKDDAPADATEADSAGTDAVAEASPTGPPRLERIRLIASHAGQTHRRGAFITLEGIEGAGKTTQRDEVAAFLRRAGCDVLVTREPGGSEIAERIRALLLDPANAGMTPTRSCC
jgi:hypothetical protein